MWPAVLDGGVSLSRQRKSHTAANTKNAGQMVNPACGTVCALGCLTLAAWSEKERFNEVRNRPAQETEIARAILRYLQVHPEAKDTLEGIAQWWLLREWTTRKFQQIEASVSDLVAEGLVVERRREGSPPYYWLNGAKQDEIARILNSNSNDSL